MGKGKRRGREVKERCLVFGLCVLLFVLYFFHCLTIILFFIIDGE